MNFEQLKISNPDKYLIEHIDKNISNFFFRKSSDFIDESEYRIIIHDPDNKFSSIDINSCLEGIILGDRFPKSYLPLLSKYNKFICKQLKILNWDYMLLDCKEWIICA